MQRKVLVTGASGAVGYAVTHALRERGHSVRGFDREPAREPGEHLVGDLLEEEALARAVDSVEVVVHCAAVPDRQNFPRELVPTNITGTHFVLEAARVAGVRHFIYVSSVRVVGGIDWEQGRIGLEAGLVPGDHYGVSKAAGELLARMYADRFGMSVLSARLGWFVRNREEARLFESVRSAPRIYVSHRDTERFFVRAVETPLASYAAVFVTSQNGGDSAFDLEPARQLVGFVPQDTWPSGSQWSEDMHFDSPLFGASIRPTSG
ncbi:MAG: NAD-dependent epimerase/dehydratase family protein [Myxococcota bacterium]